MNDKLREKMAKLAGFEYMPRMNAWNLRQKDGLLDLHEDIPNFTESLDACFKHLVPKFKEMCASRSDYEGLETCDNDIHIFLRLCEGGGWTTKGWMGSIQGFRTLSGVEGAETAALAFCLALEKLIDGEK